MLIHVRGASGSAGNWGGGGVQGSGGEHVREGGQEFGGEREQSDPPISAVCVCVCAEVGSKHRAKMFLQWPLGFVSGLMGF